MTITWLGQSCFRIEAKEGTILIDPFSKDIGLKAPRIKDDLVLVSHDHHDHNNIADAPQEALIIRTPGEYERKGIAVRGIQSFHDKEQGTQRGFNTIYVIKAEEITLCHLGDFGEGKLTDAQVEEIGDVDILMVPVGGTYTIDAKEAVEVTTQIEPKVVIPMHYKIPGLSVDLADVKVFIKEVGLTSEEVDRYKVQKKTLPVEEMKLIVLQPA